MRKMLLIVMLVASTSQLHSQDSPRRQLPFSDTTLTEITLPLSLCSKRIIEVNTFKGWIIYMEESNVRKKVMACLADNPGDEDDEKLLSALDKSKSDTIPLPLGMHSLRYFLSEELEEGKAMVVNTITKIPETKLLHRIERIISFADIVFYLSNRRRLLSVHRYWGVIPNEYFLDVE